MKRTSDLLHHATSAASFCSKTNSQDWLFMHEYASSELSLLAFYPGVGPMYLFGAVGENPLWGQVVDFFGRNPWVAIIAIGVIAGTMTDITRRILRHRERIAMIQAGMHPDERRRERGGSNDE
jgi:hypothetical protein